MMDAAQAPKPEKLPVDLKCLNCGAQAQLGAATVTCPKCRSEWPVRERIPRFFQSDGYWGEVGRQEATDFLMAARQGAWEEVVRSRFTDPNMLNGLMNLQRASWLPLLGLDSGAVTLDIGCGYGAITNSLALSAGHVYSVEAIPERIEFTQERLRQEGLHNVTLVQASALALPFLDNSFDLVVVNGVLEWVGEWDLTDTPRAIQLKFLSSVRRMLKDDGVMVIGIENRIGFGLFLGSLDHSGLPYTTLVPRRLASLMLQRSSRQHHRTVLNSKREYRTYTYSASGYRKLLEEAGFPSVTAYWADPGYNEPSRLIPVDAREWVRECFLDQLHDSAGSRGASARHQLKRAFAKTGLLPWMVPDFLLVAPKNLERTTKLETWVRDTLLQRIPNEDRRDSGNGKVLFAAGTHPDSDKSVLRVWKPEAARGRFVIKSNVRPARRRREDVHAEFANLARVRERLRQQAARRVRAPEPVSSIQIGQARYVAESSACGMQLSSIARQPGYTDDLEAVRGDFTEAITAAAELAVALKGMTDVDGIDARWYEVPGEIKAEPKLAGRLQSARYMSQTPGDLKPVWVQHGDLSIENIFLDRITATAEIIDWGELAGGLPPLYDIFTLILSSNLLEPSHWQESFATPEERWKTSFSDLFLSRQGLGGVFTGLIAQACGQLAVSTELLPALLLEFLLIRTHYYRSQDEPFMAGVHVNLLRDCLEREDFVTLLAPPVSPRAGR